MMQSLRKQIRVAISAGEAAIRVDTDEIEDALTTITKVCEKKLWPMRVWDHSAGVVWCANRPANAQAGHVEPPGNSMAEMMGAPPPAPTCLQVIAKFLNEDPIPDPGAPGGLLAQVLVIKNFHLAFESNRGATCATIQHLVCDAIANHPQAFRLRPIMAARGVDLAEKCGKFLIGLMPAEANLPPEIRPLFKTITHELPDEAELATILSEVSAEDTKRLSKADKQQACHHALGLTRLQAEGVFAAAIAEYADNPEFGKLLVPYVWTEKSKILNEEGLVTLYQGDETFDDVVGHEGLKKLFLDLMKPDSADPDNPELRAKGVALVGPPRTGKSQTVKALGNESGRPLLFVDVGSWFGSHIGDTEASTRKGFQLIRAHTPCIAFIDEVEKVMPSARGYDGDGGVGRRMAGTFMTNLQEIKEDVFWVFAANDVDTLHEAFLADDRVDCIVFVGMPDAEQRAAGWKFYLKKFFPPTVNEKPYDRAVQTGLKAVLQTLAEAKGKPNVAVWASQILPSVLCVADRARALKTVAEASPAVAEALQESLFDDSQWTVARIKSCCRLARKRGISVSEAAKMMPRSQKKLDKAIARLQRWAEEEAIDAKTGVAYVSESKEEATQETGVRSTRSRRTVRSTREE